MAAPHKEISSQRASWNTPRSNVPARMSYATRMALSFAGASLLTVLILVAVIVVVWSGAFNDYTRANVEEIALQTAERLARSYEEDGPWTAEYLQQLAETSIVSDIGLQVMDADGSIIYDDTWPAASAATDAAEAEGSGTSSATARIPDNTAQLASNTTADSTDNGSAVGGTTHRGSLTSTAPTDVSGSVTEPVVLSDGTQVGMVRLWVLGSDVLLSKADTAFRDNTFNAVILASIIALAISIVVGFLVSRTFTNPIRRITDTAQQIRDGDLTARTGMRGDDEIDRLGETFDEMATSLERDLRHERRITSDVAHELRTPLMGMLATVEAIQDGVMDANEENLETVASETRRLARLVQQMLDLSRMENRTTPMQIQKVNILPFVERIVSSQQQLFTKHSLELRFNDETQGRNVTIDIDPDMITEAIINIMSNAMRYTPEGGWVVVKLACDRREVLIAVSDTGIGIAKEDLSRIFNRFWRADASRAREAGGLGVGLSLTKQIIERHGGYIAVDSEVGKGTTFTIHLPREHTPEATSATIND